MVLLFLNEIKHDPGTPQMSMDLNLRDLFVVPYRLWSKVPPLSTGEPLQHPVLNVIVSWTSQEECETEGECVRSVLDLQKRYRVQGLDIPYNFVVGGDSTVYECRGWHRKPARCVRHPGLHGVSIEVAHIGFRGDDGQRPPPGMAWAAMTLFDYGVDTGYLVEIPIFHPDYEIMYDSVLSRKNIDNLKQTIEDEEKEESE